MSVPFVAQPRTRADAIERTKYRLLALTRGNGSPEPWRYHTAAVAVEERVLAILQGRETLPPPADIPRKGGLK